MTLLESVGIIALVVLGFFLYMKYSENKTEKDRRESYIISESIECWKLIQKYNESLRSGTPLMTKVELNRQLKLIANKPETIAEIDEKENRIKLNDAKRTREFQAQRKFGYQYESAIFEIFNDKRELPESLLILKISERYNLTMNDSAQVLTDWSKNNLVSNCQWNKAHWTVGIVLTLDNLKLTEDDVTWDEWLRLNNIKLRPDTPEYENYHKPFW